jgi:ubiquinone/menaquinone biosynthesis C-methylase UbiE
MYYLLLFVEISFAAAVIIALYFLLVTRVSLIIRSLTGGSKNTAHIYWIYSNRFLIWLTDRPLIISAILLFNYRRLVRDVVGELNPSLEGKRLLQVSCAFGDITRRIVEKCAAGGAEKVVIFDLMPNEVTHSRRVLERAGLANRCHFALEDTVSIAHRDSSFDYVVFFFLFHELPFEMKRIAIVEAARVLRPGGRIIFGEFHRPRSVLLRASGRLFFRIFERYAREMWGKFDARAVLEADTPDQWEFKKTTYFGGNYQVFSARKAG